MNWRETIENAFSEPMERWPTGWRESYPALSEPDLTEVKRRLLAALSSKPGETIGGEALAIDDDLLDAVDAIRKGYATAQRDALDQMEMWAAQGNTEEVSRYSTEAERHSASLSAAARILTLLEKAASAPPKGNAEGVKDEKLERWQVPARELDDTELTLEYDAAAEKFDNRGEHGGSPGEFWAERMDEIDQERKRRKATNEKGTDSGVAG